jgi:hypothetical protein
MDTIRLFFRSNSFRNLPIKADVNPESSQLISNVVETSNPLLENTQHLTQRSSSSEKVSRDNVKSFFSSHPSSSSLFSRFSFTSSQVQTCSGLSIPPANNSNDTTVVASASASISNAVSFTCDSHRKEHDRVSIRNLKRRYSWNCEEHHRHISSPMRRSKSHRYSDGTRHNLIIHKYPTEKLRRRIIQVNRSSKSVSFPLSTNMINSIISTQNRSVRTTATNAFLTAASIRKYLVPFFFDRINFV